MTYKFVVKYQYITLNFFLGIRFYYNFISIIKEKYENFFKLIIDLPERHRAGKFKVFHKQTTKNPLQMQ